MEELLNTHNNSETKVCYNKTNTLIKLNTLSEGKHTLILNKIYESCLEYTALWKKGTTLIVGDSMLYVIDETTLRNTKVWLFPGSMIEDIYFNILYPLLQKHMYFNIYPLLRKHTYFNIYPFPKTYVLQYIPLTPKSYVLKYLSLTPKTSDKPISCYWNEQCEN